MPSLIRPGRLQDAQLRRGGFIPKIPSNERAIKAIRGPVSGCILISLDFITPYLIIIRQPR